MAHTGEQVAKRERLSAHEIFEIVERDAEDELARPWSALGFSGFAAGLTMGISALAVAAAHATLGDGEATDFIATMLYPIGFIAVIIGRAQLFTENTLYPVVLVLDEREHLGDTLKLWGIVLGANLVGALMFAVLAVSSGALEGKIAAELVSLGDEAAAAGTARLFWGAVVGGWLIALVAWLVSASRHTIGQVAVIWSLTFLLGLGDFAHSIAGAAETLSALVRGAVGLPEYLRWQGLVTVGNVVGGVFIVSLLNYGQVRSGDNEDRPKDE